jgi:hypothetical protein
LYVCLFLCVSFVSVYIFGCQKKSKTFDFFNNNLSYLRYYIISLTDLSSLFGVDPTRQTLYYYFSEFLFFSETMDQSTKIQDDGVPLLDPQHTEKVDQPEMNVNVTSAGVQDGEPILDPQHTDPHQAELHTPNQRIRPAWTIKVADSYAEWMARELWYAICLTFIWQIGVRALGLDPKWAPSALIKVSTAALSPTVKSVAAYVADALNVFQWARRLNQLLRPTYEEVLSLVKATIGFCVMLVLSVVDGYTMSSEGVYHFFVMSIIGVLLSIVILILAEAAGMKWGKFFRPSFWLVTVGNVWYQKARVFTQLYCYGLRLLTRFPESIRLLLSQFPWLNALVDWLVLSTKYVIMAMLDVLLAIPYGIGNAMERFRKYMEWDWGYLEKICVATFALGVLGMITWFELSPPQMSVFASAKSTDSVLNTPN